MLLFININYYIRLIDFIGFLQQTKTIMHVAYKKQVDIERFSTVSKKPK